MEHSFNVQIAQMLGIEEAILVHNFYYWIVKNAANDKHQHEGLFWTYNSKKAYSELFPYMNETKIGRVIKHLEDVGLLVKGNYNENKWDKTNWYAFTKNGIEFLHSIGYDVRLLQNDTLDNVKVNNGTMQNDSFITNNKTQDNNTNKKENSEKDKELFEECWIAYRRKGSKKKSKEYWNKLTDVERTNVLPHIKPYVASREMKYQKDFERYLRDKIFLDVVISNNNIVYDPTKMSDSKKGDSVYMPICDGSLMYNDFFKCYMYIGYWDGKHIADGYTDDNRPDGACITLNNGRGTICWSSLTKTWNKV